MTNNNLEKTILSLAMFFNENSEKQNQEFLNKLYEIFDKLMFATDGDISSTFGKIRNKLDATQKKWISQGEKDNLEEISKAMSVQKQREFVPYA